MSAKRVIFTKYDNGFTVESDLEAKVYFDFRDALDDIRKQFEIDQNIDTIQYNELDMSDFDDILKGEEVDRQLEKTVQSLFTRIGDGEPEEAEDNEL